MNSSIVTQLFYSLIKLAVFTLSKSETQ